MKIDVTKMLFGLDTSGKVGQCTMYIAVVKADKNDDKFQETVRSIVLPRHKGLATRRKIKSSDLTRNEREKICKLINKSDYFLRELTSDTCRKLTKKYRYASQLEVKLFASCVHITCHHEVKDGDVILIEREYSNEEQLTSLTKFVEILFKEINKINVHVEIGLSISPTIDKADKIAGCGRSNIINAEPITEKELDQRMEKLKIAANR